MGAHGCSTATKFALEALSEALAQEVKAFNIRVAIVEPGIMQTAIFDKMPEDPPASRYPHEGRLRALHAAGLGSPVSPFVAGEAIRQIVESDSEQLRYPVGPDALPFLEKRAGMTDEAWVNWNTPRATTNGTRNSSATLGWTRGRYAGSDPLRAASELRVGASAISRGTCTTRRRRRSPSSAAQQTDAAGAHGRGGHEWTTAGG